MIHVVLVQPEIHWNTGNAGRTCLAVGAQLHLVRPLGFSLGERQLRRAGLDYWERVRPRLWDDWETFERNLPALGTPFFFSAGASRALWATTFPADAVLLFGGESAGFPQQLRERFPESFVSIPMLAADVRSLNLSTAVAIAAYEALRQQRSAG
jgi:tRNA (cytidine/uridine-2'-O-)-methyltransferase